jgi:hypothetical protein
MTSFARDIQPLFRDYDIEEMLFMFDLGKYEDVKENAQGIYEVLADGSMPCDTPWPEEQVQLFQQWIAEGTPE